MQIDKLSRPKDEEGLVRSTIDGILNGRAEAHQVLSRVPTEAFTIHRARDIWDAIGHIVRSGQPPDFPNIERRLYEQGKLVSDESWHRHQDWLSAYNGFEDETKLAKTVVGLYQRREMLKLLKKAEESLQCLLLDHVETSQSLSASALKIISGDSEEPILAGDEICYYVENGLKFQEDQDSPGKLAYLGLPKLDASVEEGGISCAPGHVILVAGRPGNFKTTWGIHLLGATATHGTECLFCSLELGKEEVKQRIAGWFTEAKRSQYWYGTYTDYHTARLKVQREIMNHIKIWSPSRPSWSRIEAKIRGAALRGVKVALIDHFSEIDTSGLILPDGSKGFEYKKEIAQRIKALAKELKICIIVLCQLNREIEKNKAPDMENLRETGELEQIAYSIIVLWKVEPESTPSISVGPDAAPPKPPQFKYTVVKNREGKSFYTNNIHPDGSTCHIMEM